MITFSYDLLKLCAEIIVVIHVAKWFAITMNISIV
jgi:hypothetical protein